MILKILRNAVSAASVEEQNWQALINHAGVMQAIRDQADMEDLVFPDARADHWSWDTSLKPHGAGSMRCAVLDGDGQNNGTLLVPIAPDSRVFGPSQSQKAYCFQFRQYMPEAFCYAVYPSTSGPNAPFANGQKHLILSHTSGSNQNNEVVIEDSYQMGGPLWYYQDGASGVVDDWISILGATAYRVQTDIDNGGSATNFAEARQRYGLIYSSEDDFVGVPNLPQGGFYYLPDEWMTWQVWVDFTAGFSQTRVAIWSQHEGQAPVRWVNRLVQLGSANGGHNAGWPNSFCTARTSNGGFDTHTNYGGIVTADQLLPMGGYEVTLQ